MVTGGSQGIGYGVANNLAESDARLWLEFLAVAAGAGSESHVATAEDAVRATRLVDTCYNVCRPAGSREIA
jgi:NAD(P)-dependent dehydrogenase (short-subunit alcohol dehydrogenase family)